MQMIGCLSYTGKLTIGLSETGQAFSRKSGTESDEALNLLSQQP